VNFFRHENLGKRNGVISGIVNDTGGVEYSLSKEMNVGGRPEQSGVGISSRYLRDLLSINHYARSCQITACVMSHNTINK